MPTMQQDRATQDDVLAEAAALEAEGATLAAASLRQWAEDMFDVRPATEAEQARGMLPWVIHRITSGFVLTHRTNRISAEAAAADANRAEAAEYGRR